ncbi:MAG TPA: SulP family inorganic anion transporter [Pirellulaceae bacterium]|nr:SulP family inorganic anion transporter [Pirellulaceae bacterium]
MNDAYRPQGNVAPPLAAPTSFWAHLRYFCNPIDARYEELRRDSWYLVVLRDFSAGLIVAMMAIPLAMGFAMASGLKPVQGIVGGAVAGLIGALFGGSKYQVYGPTAAFIPVIAGLMLVYTPLYGFEAAHGTLVLAAMVAGVILLIMGLARLGRLARLVPHSIVVGFTIGIAVTIALSQVGEVLGLHAGFKLTEHELVELEKKSVAPAALKKLHNLTGREFATRTLFLKELGTVLAPDELKTSRAAILKEAELRMPPHFFEKLRIIAAHRREFKGDALLLALVTFLITHHLLKISIYIPAPLIAIGCGIGLSHALHDPELTTIGGKYGVIPTEFFVLTPPQLPSWEWTVLRDVGYLVAAIVFVSGVESLLCSRMADRLADNRGTPFDPNKEFWGQGLVQVVVPLLNGFPHTGALARTATNIKLGAMTPLAGIFKCVLKLLLAFFLAGLLALVPMACIGGILMWVAFNMVKPAEVKQVLAHNWFHIGLMVLTAIAVIITDFLTGVLTGMIAYALLFKFLDTPSQQQSNSGGPDDTVVEDEAAAAEPRQPVVA